MSYVQERKDIEERLRDYFDSSIIPVQYENLSSLKKGTETIKDMNTVDKFVRLTISNASTVQFDVGGVQDRYTGIITLGVFTKANRGTNIGRKIADDLFPIYHRQAFANIQCREASMENFSDNTEGWYQTNINIEYYRDEEFILPVKLA